MTDTDAAEYAAFDAANAALVRELDAEQDARDLRIPGLHIEGRRWFQRTYGNTYHSVRIWIGGEMVAHLPYSYGYGDQFLQTALDWLKANGLAPQDAQYGTLYLRETLGGTYSVYDVSRKRDL